MYKLLLLFLLGISFKIPPVPVTPPYVTVSMPVDVMMNDSTVYLIIKPDKIRVYFDDSDVNIDSIIFVNEEYGYDDSVTVWEY